MRWLSFALVSCSLVACSGYADLEPTDIALRECPGIESCPLLAGGELVVRPVFHTGFPEYQTPAKVFVMPSSLAEVTVVGDRIVIRAAIRDTRLGGTIDITLEDGFHFTRSIEVQPLATTTVVPAYSDVESYVGETLPRRFALAPNASLDVDAEHRDASARRLLGHGPEQWSIENATLEPDQPLRMRVRAGEVGPVRVSAGGDPLVLDVVPPGTTARLEILFAFDRVGDDDRMYAYRSFPIGFDVRPVTSDGRVIAGLAGCTASSSNPDIVGVTARGCAISVEGLAFGLETVSVELDGQRRDIAVEVR